MILDNNIDNNFILFKNLYEEISLIRGQVNFNIYMFENGRYDDDCRSKYFRYIIINKNDKTKFICGNLIYLICNIHKITDCYFEYDIKTLYGIIERYKIIKEIINVNDVIIYDLNLIYNYRTNKRPKKKYCLGIVIDKIDFNNKSLIIKDIDFNKFKYENDFYKYIGTYFNVLGTNRHKLYYEVNDEDNIYTRNTTKIVSKNILFIQHAITKSKKENLNNIPILV